MVAVGLSARFAGSRLTANTVRPGGIRTGLTRHLSQAKFRARVGRR
jgi:NAD(P)-dependent dehydrogenase (short-subunit alcohol dehydrogenase family)